MSGLTCGTNCVNWAKKKYTPHPSPPYNSCEAKVYCLLISASPTGVTHSSSCLKWFTVFFPLRGWNLKVLLWHYPEGYKIIWILLIQKICANILSQWPKLNDRNMIPERYYNPFYKAQLRNNSNPFFWHCKYNVPAALFSLCEQSLQSVCMSQGLVEGINHSQKVMHPIL